jgi:citronellol/citronellal dehydrogenase
MDLGLKDRVAIVTGSSKGLGFASARALIAEGCRVVICARTPDTLQEARRRLAEIGGESRVLAVASDVSQEEGAKKVVDQAVTTFGGIDVLVNNASAIWLRGTLDTPMKRFDLMQQVNARGSFLCAQPCLPHQLQAPSPHILTLCPPPSLDPKWWAPHTGYTLAKMGMSFVTLGLAGEFGPRGVAVNALWPRTLIATDALNMIPGVSAGNGRSPAIMADAAHAILTRPAAGFSGRFLIDDEVLAEAGVTDLSGYAVDPSQPLFPDLFLD